jgi:hypothetical protein
MALAVFVGIALYMRWLDTGPQPRLQVQLIVELVIHLPLVVSVTGQRAQALENFNGGGCDFPVLPVLAWRAVGRHQSVLNPGGSPRPLHWLQVQAHALQGLSDEGARACSSGRSAGWALGPLRVWTTSPSSSICCFSAPPAGVLV